MSSANDCLPNAVSSASAAVAVTPRSQLPTAIVRPKHKKTSFDDRQLPIIPNVNREQPWFDKAGSASSQATRVSVPETARKQIAPQVERKSKKHHTKTAHSDLGSAETSSSDGDHAGRKPRPRDQAKPRESRKYSADKKGSSVAVVQPRKKERMDERKLMETIVQMQIKKNSMDNRNGNQTAKEAPGNEPTEWMNGKPN